MSGNILEGPVMVDKKRKSFNLKSKITSALRKIWLFSPQRRAAVKRAKDNGNKCENPKCGAYQERLEVDHRDPVVPIDEGERDWNVYIARLMVDENGLENLCTHCHKAKTMTNAEQRKKNKEKLKKSLTDKKK